MGIYAFGDGALLSFLVRENCWIDSGICLLAGSLHVDHSSVSTAMESDVGIPRLSVHGGWFAQGLKSRGRWDLSFFLECTRIIFESFLEM